MTDAGERVAHAEQTLSLLFPGDRPDRQGAGTDTGTRRFALAPSTRQPRLLLPVDSGRASGAALRSYGGRLNARARYAGVAYRALVQASRGRVLRPAYTVNRRPGRDIEAVLGAVLQREVRVAVHLTPARANRKPILQVIDPRGSEPIGFVKIATNELTAQLLTTEAAALTRLAGAADLSFRVPELLHFGDFDGHPMLVTGALPTWQRGHLPKPRELIRAASEIAGLAPITAMPLADSPFWRGLQADTAAVSRAAARDRIRSSAQRIEAVCGASAIGFGVGHGDFSPWNMWSTGPRLLIWDWERFSGDVPVGTDLVHYKLQSALARRGQHPGGAAASVLATAPDRTVAVLHLFSLAVRYAKDDQLGAGAAIGDANDWLLPAIDVALHHDQATTVA